MIKNHLTGEEYRKILYVVGKSKTPLTSQEIITVIRSIYPSDNSDIKESQNKEKENTKDEMKDTYRKIKELVPFRYILDKRSFLFEYDKFPLKVRSYKDFQSLTKIINLIKKYDKKGWFNFRWNELDFRLSSGEYHLDDRLEVNKEKDDRLEVNKEKEDVFIISYGSQEIVINLNNRTYSYFREKEKTSKEKEKIFSIGLYILEKDNTKIIYTIEHESNSTIYLTPVLNEDAKKKNKFISENFQTLKYYPDKILTDPYNTHINLGGKERDQVMNILTDNRFWEYTLTFNGLLLYLLCESKKDYNQDSEKRIIEVLSNDELIENRAPFFQYWADFNQVGFDVYSVIRKLCYDFETEILRDYKDKYFTAKLCDRCFNVVNNYFNFKSPLVLHNLLKGYKENYRKYDIAKKVYEYNKMMLHNKETFLKDELNRVEQDRKDLNLKI